MIPDKILYLDDDPTLLMVVSATIKRKYPDMEVITCISTQEAADNLKKQPDLILVDYFLQDATGVEFIETIRKPPHNNISPAILVTGNNDVQLSKSGEDLGIFGVIHKPTPLDRKSVV